MDRPATCWFRLIYWIGSSGVSDQHEDKSLRHPPDLRQESGGAPFCALQARLPALQQRVRACNGRPGWSTLSVHPAACKVHPGPRPRIFPEIPGNRAMRRALPSAVSNAGLALLLASPVPDEWPELC